MNTSDRIFFWGMYIPRFQTRVENLLFYNKTIYRKWLDVFLSDWSKSAWTTQRQKSASFLLVWFVPSMVWCWAVKRRNLHESSWICDIPWYPIIVTTCYYRCGVSLSQCVVFGQFFPPDTAILKCFNARSPCWVGSTALVHQLRFLKGCPKGSNRGTLRTFCNPSSCGWHYYVWMNAHVSKNRQLRQFQLYHLCFRLLRKLGWPSLKQICVALLFLVLPRVIGLNGRGIYLGCVPF